MVSDGYSDLGEEWAQKHTWRQDLISRSASVDVLLFDDSTDNTDDTSDVGDITTELSGGNYTRQSLNLDTSDFTLSLDANDNLRAAGTVMFDLTDTSGDFDAYGIVANFQSDIVGSDGSATDHLIASAVLEGAPYDASLYTGFDVEVRGDLN